MFLVVDFLLLCVAAAGLPMTFAQRYAWFQLLSHLVWVAMGVKILGTRLKPFFPPPFGKGSWTSFKWRTKWLGWVIGGYCVSSFGCNSVDLLRTSLYDYAIKQSILPPLPADVVPESVVSKLIQPGGGDIGALVVGFVAPCITGPLWEEFLYRGFLLSALLHLMPIKRALPLHALIFALVHRDPTVIAPLTVLAFLWGWLYMVSGNLLVPILTHALWNSHFFIESLLEGAAL